MKLLKWALQIKIYKHVIFFSPAEFNQVKEVILKNIKILLITESNLDDTFPLGQIFVEGFSKSYRIVKNRIYQESFEKIWIAS